MLEILETRFGMVPDSIGATINQIEDTDLLKTLLKRAITILMPNLRTYVSSFWLGVSQVSELVIPHRHQRWGYKLLWCGLKNYSLFTSRGDSLSRPYLTHCPHPKSLSQPFDRAQGERDFESRLDYF
ncbi:hypothetical protein [[Phormidium] sp. ETS-05]|uniref:hypothetical protein n=1 Tax=[Phormidium] sp. ETS-05 TaxID=222819 RepID=UPI0018EF0EAF|nr:hypothetical protein [[Phormidium] sp. ETS-05]